MVMYKCQVGKQILKSAASMVAIVLLIILCPSSQLDEGHPSLRQKQKEREIGIAVEVDETMLSNALQATFFLVAHAIQPATAALLLVQISQLTER